MKFYFCAPQKTLSFEQELRKKQGNCRISAQTKSFKMDFGLLLLPGLCTRKVDGLSIKFWARKRREEQMKNLIFFVRKKYTSGTFAGVLLVERLLQL